MTFDVKFFYRLSYTPEQISKFFTNAKNDLQIAMQHDEEASIAYRFCYDAIVKLGIAVIAENGYKVRSIPGHHIKILEQLGKILGLSEEIGYFDRVRRKRNVDLYEGGSIFSATEASELIHITKSVFDHALKNPR